MSLLDKKITISRRGFLKFLGLAPAAVAAAKLPAPAIAAPAATVAPAAVAGSAMVGESVAGAAIRNLAVSWRGLEWFGSYFNERHSISNSRDARRELNFSMAFKRGEDIPQVGDTIDIPWLAARSRLHPLALTECPPRCYVRAMFDEHCAWEDGLKFVIISVTAEQSHHQMLLAHIEAHELRE